MRSTSVRSRSINRKKKKKSRCGEEEQRVGKAGLTARTLGCVTLIYRPDGPEFHPMERPV
jgi:hypothetical protein